MRQFKQTSIILTTVALGAKYYLSHKILGGYHGVILIDF